MSTEKRQPRWWQVYVMLPMFMGLFWLELKLPLTYTENIVAQLGILALIFVCMELWLHANRSAFMNLEEEEGEWQVRVYQFPSAPAPSDARFEDRELDVPMLQLPAAGLKGSLSDTFEWERVEEGSGVYADPAARSRKAQE